MGAINHLACYTESRVFHPDPDDALIFGVSVSLSPRGHVVFSPGPPVFPSQKNQRHAINGHVISHAQTPKYYIQQGSGSGLIPRPPVEQQEVVNISRGDLGPCLHERSWRAHCELKAQGVEGVWEATRDQLCQGGEDVLG